MTNYIGMSMSWEFTQTKLYLLRHWRSHVRDSTTQTTIYQNVCSLKELWSSWYDRWISIHMKSKIVLGFSNNSLYGVNFGLAVTKVRWGRRWSSPSVLGTIGRWLLTFADPHFRICSLSESDLIIGSDPWICHTYGYITVWVRGEE